MDKELEEAIKRALITKHRGTTLISVEILEAVLKELKRLQEENEDLKQANREKQNKLIEITDLYIKSVPKDKIREKIGEQKKLMEKYLKAKEYGQVDIRLYKIAILEELLEEK